VTKEGVRGDKKGLGDRKGFGKDNKKGLGTTEKVGTGRYGGWDPSADASGGNRKRGLGVTKKKVRGDKNGSGWQKKGFGATERDPGDRKGFGGTKKKARGDRKEGSKRQKRAQNASLICSG
jgi:hypothetical protein